MNISEEIKSLSQISDRFRKNKKREKAHWPTEFQLRVLKLIESGYSPRALSQKLNIPPQTYYHWRRFWKKKNLKFIAVPVSDKLKDSTYEQKTPNPVGLSTVLIFPNGVRVENISSELLTELLRAI